MDKGRRKWGQRMREICRKWVRDKQRDIQRMEEKEKEREKEKRAYLILLTIKVFFCSLFIVFFFVNDRTDFHFRYRRT